MTFLLGEKVLAAIIPMSLPEKGTGYVLSPRKQYPDVS
jgi:hypothetical protein